MATDRTKEGKHPVVTVPATDSKTRLDGLRHKVFLDRYSLKDDQGNPTEDYPEQMWRRVATGIASVEATPELRTEWADRFYDLLRDFKFVPGGRILAGAGTGKEVTYYNCYVLPAPEDSRQGIVENLGAMIDIMARGGGVGINLSSLRPRGSHVKTVNGTSSGPVPWGHLYSTATGKVIQQGGCFGPDQRIATNRGLLRAAELADRLDAGEAIDALTHEGPRRITCAFRNGTKPLFRVTSARGFTVAVTQEHKMGVFRDGGLVTIPLAELEVGDEVVLFLGEGVDAEYVTLGAPPYERSIMSTRLNDSVHLPNVLDERLAYLVGYMHGDGYVQWGRKITWAAPKGIMLTTADTYPEIRDKLMTITCDLFGLEPVLVNRPGEACMTVGIYSRVLVEWLRHNGLLKAHTEDVRVPEPIFHSPSSVVSAFIAGYFDADGSDRGRKGGYGFDSVCREMLHDVQQLLAAHGILSHIQTTDRVAAGWKPIHRLVVTGAEFKERMNAFLALAGKNRGVAGHRNHNNNYPRDVWATLDVPGSYYQSLWDSTKSRISFRALTHVQERLISTGDVALAERVEQLLRVMPDHIASIEALEPSAVYDFEVDDVHMLSGNGFYTSNSRRGALMLMLDDTHPDLEEFITAKQIKADGRPALCEHANLSVCISDAFMNAVKADLPWDLQWHGKIYKTVRARDIWHLICESAWRTAEPGMVFIDQVNQLAPSNYFEELRCVNPCVTGDTLIYTAHGLAHARDLAARPGALPIEVDSRFGRGSVQESSGVFPTGVKPVYRLETVEGYTVRLTANHRVATPSGWVEARHLKPGDQVCLLDHKGGFGAAGSRELGQVLGWLVGDGTLKATQGVLSFFGSEKHELAPAFARMVHAVTSDQARATARVYAPVGVVDIAARDEARVTSTYLWRLAEQHGLTNEKLCVPDAVVRGSEEMQRGFLQALFTADGHVSGSLDKGVSVRLTSVSLSLLQAVQRILLNFGIASTIYSNRRAQGSRLLPDGRGASALYACQAYHDLVIAKDNLVHFADEINFLIDAKQSALRAHLAAYRRGPYRERFLATFSALVADGEEEVYDLTEPATHSFIGNGLTLHNCGEQPLPPWGVCNLGALNLSAFVADDVMDYTALAEASRAAMRFLDNVIDANLYFNEENRQAQQFGARRTGLGTMGLADALIKLKVAYGSPESLQIVDRIYATIRDAAYDSSSDLATEKGSFPKLDSAKHLAGPFLQDLPAATREKIAAQGLRNAVLLTQAPTGTTSLLAGVSSGIEPVYDFVMKRTDRIGEHIIYHPLLQQWQAAHPDAPVPSYFVGAKDLGPEEHVAVQARVQKYTDSSISKTCNAPNDHTVDEVKRLYMLAYDLGCKGVTYYRDGSRDAVLTSVTEQPVAVTPAPTPPPPPKRTKIKPRPPVLHGYTRNVKAPEGTANITINGDEEGPLEVFVAVGRAGSDIAALAEALGRLISLTLRLPSDMSAEDRLREVAGQLRGIGGSRSIGFGPQRVLSLPDAVAQALATHLAEHVDQPLSSNPVAAGEAAVASLDEPPATASHGNGHMPSTATLPAISVLTGNLCPQCGSSTSFVFEEGCKKCYGCGYSEC